jgi:hypothetical protein
VVDEPDGQVMAAWFEREFERLWTHRSTASGTEGQALLAQER